MKTTRFLLVLPLVFLLPCLAEGVEVIKRLPRINNNFGIELFKEVSKQGKNSFLSPLGILSSLGILYKGSNGVSYDEITSSLHLGVPGKDLVGATLHLAVKEFNKILKKANNSANILVANRAFFQEGYGINKNYIKALRYYYGVNVDELNFKEESLESMRRINTWVKDQTNGRIRSMVQKPFDRETLLVLINALYFRGSWQEEFPGSRTTKSRFLTGTTSTIEVEMMQKSAKTHYYHSRHFKSTALRLPYKSEGLSMVILLPDEVNGVERLIRELSEEAVADLFKNITESNPVPIDVHLPKFKLEHSHDLKEVLQKLGMGSLFSKSADFTLINGKKNLRVSSILHKAEMQAYEKGTEAAAIGGLETILASFRQVEGTAFKANHPFLFFITKSGTDGPELILFIGKILYPVN